MLNPRKAITPLPFYIMPYSLSILRSVAKDAQKLYPKFNAESLGKNGILHFLLYVSFELCQYCLRTPYRVEVAYM